MTAGLHVVTTDQRRGAEVRTEELVRRLVARGGDDRVVALRAIAEGPRIEAEALGPRRSRHPSTLRRLRRLVRAADVAVGHGGDTLLAVGLASWGTPIPFVYESIGDPAYWRRSPVAAAPSRLLLRRATKVVCLFPRAAEALAAEGVEPARIEVIPSGVDPGRFGVADEAERGAARRRLGVPPEVPVVAYVGSLSGEKDPLAAVAALPVEAHLVVAGTGPLRAELERASRGHGGRVRLLGSVPDVTDVYAAADVLVLPSRTEGLPGVAIEAALSGLPVVATDVGGTGAVVDHGVTGLLVPPDDVGALASALATALRPGTFDGATARTLAVERFDPEATAEAWWSLLDDVAGSGET